MSREEAGSEGRDLWGLILYFSVILGPLAWLHRRWALRRLEAWARQSQVRIVRRQERLLFQGPFKALGKYTVFRVTVEDRWGQERIGWVRLGGFWVGLWSDDSRVVWEGERKDPG